MVSDWYMVSADMQCLGIRIEKENDGTGRSHMRITEFNKVAKLYKHLHYIINISQFKLSSAPMKQCDISYSKLP